MANAERTQVQLEEAGQKYKVLSITQILQSKNNDNEKTQSADSGRQGRQSKIQSPKIQTGQVRKSDRECNRACTHEGNKDNLAKGARAGFKYTRELDTVETK